MKASQLALGALAVFTLAGCVGPVKSTFEDKAVDYKSSYTLDPIEFPKEYDLTPPMEAFPIDGVEEAVAGTGGSGFSVPQVPAQDPSLQQTETRILTSERVAFLRVDSLPGEIWPELTAFLEANGVGIIADRDRARIYSGWMAGVDRGKTDSNLLRYLPGAANGWRRIDLDVAPGLLEGSTEIRAQMSVNFSDTRPQPRAVADEFDGSTMSAWLDEFSIWLADAKQSGRRVSAVGLGKGADPRVVRVTREDGSLAIRVRTELEDPWQSLMTAVESMGLEPEYVDQPGNRVQLRYVSEADQRRLADLNILMWALVMSTENLDGLYQINTQIQPGVLEFDVQFLNQGGSVASAEELLLKLAEQIL